MILTTADLTEYYDNNTQVDISILDFSKAFDVVSHRKLLYKLAHYGINGPLLEWIRGFLTGRTQCVVVDGVASKPANVLSGGATRNLPGSDFISMLSMTLLTTSNLNSDFSQTMHYYTIRYAVS